MTSHTEGERILRELKILFVLNALAALMAVAIMMINAFRNDLPHFFEAITLVFMMQIRLMTGLWMRLYENEGG